MKRLGYLLAFVFACLCASFALAEPAWVCTNNGPLNMRRQASAKADIIERVPDKQLIEADEIGAQWSHVYYGKKGGYVKTEYLIPISQMIGKPVYPDAGYVYVRAQADASSQSVAVVASQQPMTILDVEELWARVSCLDEEGREVTGYVGIEEISELRQTPGEKTSAQLDARIELSANSLVVGDVLDAFVRCNGGTSYQYRLYRDGEMIFEGEPVVHGEASYRARQPGRYRLEVIVRDAEEYAIGCDAFFEVHAAEATAAFLNGPQTIYSQKDGWWQDKKYGARNLESSGCAIFTLSCALGLLGHEDEAVLPENLAESYSSYLAESGTLNSRLLASAAKAFGFSTASDKITRSSDIAERFEKGAVFSFLIVQGHVALAAGLSEDGAKVRIIDSAPSATFERIQNASLYYEDERGVLREAQTLWDIPGARYYFETGEFGGLEYYLDLGYVAKRGVRPIQPKE